MPRLRLFDCRMSRLPSVIGKCQTDLPSIANFVNSAQRRLLLGREAGDEGWYGTFAEVAFNAVSRSDPYITCPREIARLEKIDVCKRPVPIQNQFYEYLDYGNGRMPQRFRQCSCNTQVYSRNNVVTFVRQTVVPCTIRLYATDAADVTQQKRVFLQGLDSTGTTIRTQSSINNVPGEFVTLDSPFADSTFLYSQINGLQKDVTTGNVQIFQVDPATGVETLLSVMEPGEQVAGYRRYYLNQLPMACCHPSNTPEILQVTAIAKLDLIPVAVDTDYLLFHNLEAIIEECQSIRYSEIDSGAAKQMAQEKHLQAVRLLQGELVHYLGKTSPAVNFAPFGDAHLGRQKIGSLM